MRSTKQVIVIRKDLKMRRGKEIAQGAHASMGVLLSLFHNTHYKNDNYTDRLLRTFDFDPINHWLNNSFTKITVTVQTEQELIELEAKAKAANIPHCLVEDNGLTEFNGVKTKTALAIGPWWSEEIDKITGTLQLY